MRMPRDMRLDLVLGEEMGEVGEDVGDNEGHDRRNLCRGRRDISPCDFAQSIFSCEAKRIPGYVMYSRRNNSPPEFRRLPFGVALYAF